MGTLIAEILATSGLVAYYRCSESGTPATFSDLSGSSNTLTAEGSFTAGVSGENGNCFTFSGGNGNRTSCVLGASLPSAWSVFGLFKGNAADNDTTVGMSESTTGNATVSIGTGSTTPLLGSPQSTSNLRLFVRNGAGTTLVDSGVGTAFDNNWHTFLITYDGSAFRQYLDGSLLATTTIAQGTISMNRTSIGALYRSSALNAWAGSLQHVAFWTATLDDNDATRLHTAAFANTLPIDTAKAGTIGNLSFLDPGGDLYGELGIPVFYQGINGGYENTAPTVDTVVKYSGYSSLKTISGLTASFQGGGCFRHSVLGTSGRISAYVRVAALPTATCGIMRLANNSFSKMGVGVGIASNGSICLYNDNDDITLDTGDPSVVYTPDDWMRICFVYSITSTTINRFRIYVNGFMTVDATNVTISGTGVETVMLGASYQGGNNKIVYFDSIAIDDYITNYEDMGKVYVTAKLASTVQSDTWATTGGTGAVNERPANLSNYKRTTNNSGLLQSYSIESASAGDTNIDGKPFLGYMGWVYLNQSTANGTVTLYVNGNTSTITTNTNDNSFVKAYTSTSYPNATNTIGLSVTGGTSATLTLFEAGMAILYTDSAASIFSQFMAMTD